MYDIEFSPSATADLESCTTAEIEEIFFIVFAWSVDPRPDGARPLSSPEITDGRFYRYETTRFIIFYTVWEAVLIVQIEIVLKKIHLN